MQKTVESHGELTCEIADNNAEKNCIGTLKYNSFEAGLLYGGTQNSVRAQFRAICEMVDAGGMVRHGIIMMGYHNGAFGGDVLLVDGEFIGNWTSDEEEWCDFTASDSSDLICSAPSPWMLHDSIAKWVKRK